MALLFFSVYSSTILGINFQNYKQHTTFLSLKNLVREFTTLVKHKKSLITLHTVTVFILKVNIIIILSSFTKIYK